MDAAAASGRTAFDALNPYGDFGGPDVTRGKLLALGVVCALVVGAALAMGGVWAKEALVAPKPDEAETASAHADDAADDDAPSPAPAAESPSPPAVAAIEPPPVDEKPVAAAPAPEAASPPPDDERPSPAAPVQRKRPPPPKPAIVLTSVRDYTDAEVDGLDDALERGFLSRLAQLAPDLPVKRGRAASYDLGTRVLLVRLSEGAGGGAHDVTARCGLATRPKEALADGAFYEQGKQQGVEASDALRVEAVRRCGERLAETFAPIARQFLN